jgi:hypothetical protein
MLNGRGTYPTQTSPCSCKSRRSLICKMPFNLLNEPSSHEVVRWVRAPQYDVMVDCSKLHLLAVESRLASASSNVNNIHTLHSDSSFSNSSYSTRSRIMTRCLQFSTTSKGSLPQHSTQSLRPTDSPLHGSFASFRCELRSVGAHEPQPIPSP